MKVIAHYFDGKQIAKKELSLEIIPQIGDRLFFEEGFLPIEARSFHIKNNKIEYIIVSNNFRPLKYE